MAAFWRRWIGSKQVRLSLDGGAELRQLTMQDARALFVLTVRNRERLRRWMSWIDSVRDEDDTRRFIRESLRNFRLGRSLQMGIWLSDNLVGTIGLFRIASAEPEAEIGYWIDEAAEGQGIVTRAALKMVQYAFESWQVPTVRIRVEPENVRSRAIPERLGFRLRGEVEEEWADGSCRTLLVYVMHVSEFDKPIRE
ncbi:MAG: GNAT family N-acetyltransferase [Armatimonadota bacterium]|nr:GNAT family N-acetyltransferase [bacterium]MDW8322308.1 GNAT family N-acetyltransferase [Armatimonadota bacterium]